MEKLAILDCGGQYTKVIDRKVRALGVKSEIFPINIEPDSLMDFQGIILSGGPESVWHENALKCDPKLFELNKPILGICYGMHLTNVSFNGVVIAGLKSEYGECDISVDVSCPLFNGLSPKQTVLMSHGDTVKTLADGFKACAFSDDIVAAFYNESKKIYAVQFHPEVDLTVNGNKMMENFLRLICEYKDFYSLEDRIQISVDHIKAKVGDKNVIVLVSGGVDSAVTAALLAKALKPEQVFAIHIDHGLMRKDESDLICENLKKLGLRNLQRINAKERFFNSVIDIDGRKLGPLTSLTDPEEKRNLIGQVFIEVVREAAADLNLDFEQTFLAQGTLRPDLIESGNPEVSVYAHKIKTHHNDVDIIRQARAKGMIVETNWDWHKDEVRHVGKILGLDKEVTDRQPFPGPGLAVRLQCSDGNERLDESEEKNFNNLISAQSEFNAKVLPLRSVGVSGDCRTFGHLALVWCDALNWERIYSFSKQITNNIKKVNRVALVLNPHSMDSAINCNSMYINDENVELLQNIDFMVTEALKDYKISQTFSVLLPMGVTKPYSIAIRTFVTNDFMTGAPAAIDEVCPYDRLKTLANEILQKFDNIEYVLYDITGKPPATCEWQ